MKTNLRFPQSNHAKVATLAYPTAKSVHSNPILDTPNHLKREYAWHVASNLGVSFKYAWAGIRYAFITQRNFRIHVLLTLTAIAASALLQVSGMEMAVITLTCALVMVLELLNTSLESVVDLTVGQSYHELAKIAKDCAAGAVMISALAAILVASFILLPPLLTVLVSF